MLLRVKLVTVYSDANKSLHDTNDDLREALETARSAHKRPRSVVRFQFILTTNTSTAVYI